LVTSIHKEKSHKHQANCFVYRTYQYIIYLRISLDKLVCLLHNTLRGHSLSSSLHCTSHFPAFLSLTCNYLLSVNSIYFPDNGGYFRFPLNILLYSIFNHILSPAYFPCPNVNSSNSEAISLLLTRIKLSSLSSFPRKFILPYQTISLSMIQ